MYKMCCDQWLSEPTKMFKGVEQHEGDGNTTDWTLFFTALNSSDTPSPPPSLCLFPSPVVLVPILLQHSLLRLSISISMLGQR